MNSQAIGVLIDGFAAAQLYRRFLQTESKKLEEPVNQMLNTVQLWEVVPT